ERFWTRAGFEVSWWSFSLLDDAAQAKIAVERAVEADLIIFASVPEGEMPAKVRGWIENWLRQRGETEGILVGLMDLGAGLAGRAAEKYAYLRNVAHRGGMDYLTHVPE